MSNKTVQYKRTLRGSVGAGVSALFNGEGRRYFILEHKDASKYHRAGESQKIIVDQIELGRDEKCAVRFDESFSTVSRRHAAIVKDGSGWKLVQLSKTNTTFLNGHPVETEWYLQNGDEIQLSIGGPRLGFIVPEGKQSLVSSIKMTERLELFRKQALKPYKTAIVCMAVILVMLGCGGGYIIHNQGKKIDIQNNEIVSLKGAMAVKDTLIAELEDGVNRIKRDNIKKDEEIGKLKQLVQNPDAVISKEIDKVKSSVYAVITEVYYEDSSTKRLISRSQGTAFLLQDGTFVTARHCVEPWLFNLDKLQAIYAWASTTGDGKVYAEITAINMNGETFRFDSNGFMVDASYDSSIDIPFDLEEGTITLKGKVAFGGQQAALGNDWAYIKTSKNGAIENGASLSKSLKSGTTVHLLGFPKSNGINDGNNIVEPIYNKMNVSRDGLNDGRCIMVSQGVDHGNSGGPVFVFQNGKLSVIGIVSRGDSKSELYNHLVPMSNIRFN